MPGERFGGRGRLPGEGVRGRAHHLQLAVATEFGRQRRLLGIALDEADVEGALEEPGLHGLRVRDDEPRHDRGMVRLERDQHLRQQEIGVDGARADQQLAADPPAHLLQPRLQLARHREDAIGVLEGDGPGGRERDPARRAVEEPRVELLLELPDLERHRRLRHEQRLGRPGEREVLRDRVEDLDAPIRHGAPIEWPGGHSSTKPGRDKAAPPQGPRRRNVRAGRT